LRKIIKLLIIEFLLVFIGGLRRLKLGMEGMREAGKAREIQ